MKQIVINTDYLTKFISHDEIKHFEEIAVNKSKLLESENNPYRNITGWLTLPDTIDKSLLDDIYYTTNNLRNKFKHLVVIGIGGSYLGAKALYHALKSPFEQNDLLFAGINLSEHYLMELLNYLKDKEFGICVISKSGTTTEPAVAFRVIYDFLVEKVGENEANKRTIAITDKEKGALRQLSREKNFKTYVIPDDIGGRYSVLTPVGLFPLSFAQIDIYSLVNGAKTMKNSSENYSNISNNLPVQYAALRNILYKKGFLIEILANYNPKFHYLAEWWKQLYGESEGKKEKGIFPASVDFTTDLHSLGQYIQEGPRILFETVLNSLENPNSIILGEMPNDLDGLNYLKGKNVEYINQKALEGTLLAHYDGGVPNIVIEIPKIDEYYLGQLIYFFEKACGISAMMIDVNPFDQPGVEAYKNNMFRLLGKPSK